MVELIEQNAGFLELAASRYSVRKYLPKTVEKDKIMRCLEAARLAPSACNSQPWFFVIANEPGLLKELASAAHSELTGINRFIYEAPVIAALIIEKPKMISQIGGRIKDKDFYLMDIGIVAEHFCLQAVKEGLGTCMIGWFNEKKVMQLLGLPSGKRIGLLISLGYPDGPVKAKHRKSMNEIHSFNAYPNR